MLIGAPDFKKRSFSQPVMTNPAPKNTKTLNWLFLLAIFFEEQLFL
jgi:hypothetical protein